MKARKRLAAELDIEHFIRSLRLSRNLLNHTSKREKRLIAMQADRNVIRVLPIEFDYLLKDGEEVQFGNLSFKSLFVPGHTPACMAYQVGDAVFVGDTMFMPDVGSARCDFPGGDAHTLYRSMKKILSLPDQTRLFMCHDYPPNGRAVNYETTVAEQKKSNIHMHDGITEDEFVQMRSKRDASLDMPVLILPSIQINIRAGEMPPKENNGIAYLKIPLNAL